VQIALPAVGPILSAIGGALVTAGGIVVAAGAIVVGTPSSIAEEPAIPVPVSPVTYDAPDCLTTTNDCDKEWQEARRLCRQLIYEQMQQQAGRRKKRSVTGVTGGYTDVEECARGLVSERCGGNMVVH
jgi:hypothetical protein